MKRFDRRRALGDFINDLPKKVKGDIYEWRGKLYQVKPYKDILVKKYGHGASQYIKWMYKGELYGIKEFSHSYTRNVNTIFDWDNDY